MDKNRNRQKSVLTPGILQDIQMAISLGSAHTAVRKMLKFYPYRKQVFHKLIPEDYAKRVNYCRWFNPLNAELNPICYFLALLAHHFFHVRRIRVKNLLRGNIGVLDQVFFTDEAWFHPSGYVNSQNYRTWRTENPHNYTETALHPQKNRRVVCHFEASNNWTLVF